MSGDSKFFIGVVVAAIIVIGVMIGFSKNKPTPTAENLDLSTAQKIGEDSLPVKIVEFGDFQCPACAAAAGALRETVEKNKSVVQLSYLHFPLPQHNNGIASAIAAEAAGSQGKFWEMYDLLYENQKQWESLKEPNSTFVVFARQLGLNIDEFERSLNNTDLKRKIEKDADYGSVLGVSQTPTFYVNGKLVTGARSAADWQPIIDEALKAQQ